MNAQNLILCMRLFYLSGAFYGTQQPDVINRFCWHKFTGFSACVLNKHNTFCSLNGEQLLRSIGRLGDERWLTDRSNLQRIIVSGYITSKSAHAVSGHKTPWQQTSI